MAVSEDGQPAGPLFEGLSHAQEGKEAVVGALKEVISQALQSVDGKAEALGMALAGHIDDAEGVVKWAPNFGETVGGTFKPWKNVQLREPLKERFQLPILMGNDANLAALGEYMFGCGQGMAKCLVLLTLGTGIGGGVVMSPDAVQGDARGPLLLLGGNKGGMELGHMCIQQGGLSNPSGLYGTLEAYCQRDSIVQRAFYKLQKGRSSLVDQLVKQDWSQITPKILTQAADQGDALAIEVWEEVGRYLGVGIGNCINIFAPDILALGGQISRAGRWLLEPAIKEARNTAIPTLYADTRIMLAQQGEKAGILGGAALAMSYPLS
jgi:glucokinase